MEADWFIIACPVQGTEYAHHFCVIYQKSGSVERESYLLYYKDLRPSINATHWPAKPSLDGEVCGAKGLLTALSSVSCF